MLQNGINHRNVKNIIRLQKLKPPSKLLPEGFNILNCKSTPCSINQRTLSILSKNSVSETNLHSKFVIAYTV